MRNGADLASVKRRRELVADVRGRQPGARRRRRVDRVPEDGNLVLDAQ
jgi:hypothetical protein